MVQGLTLGTRTIFFTIDAEPCWELRCFPFLKFPQQLKRYMCEKFRFWLKKKQKVCSLDLDEEVALAS